MAGDEKKYINFPICLLKGIFEDKSKCLKDILYFHLYNYALNDTTFDIKLYERFKRAADYFGFELFPIQKVYDKARELCYANTKEKQPFSSMTTDILRDFLYNDKSRDELVEMLGYLAIRSIVGERVYRRSTYDFIFSRMAGNSSLSTDIGDILNKYNTRRKRENLKIALNLHWGVSLYSDNHLKGVYVSSVLSLEKLVQEITKIVTKKKDEKKRYDKIVKNAKKSTYT